MNTLTTLGHATNAELLAAVRVQYPDLSATTIHRATARLAERGLIATAPPAQNGSMRYDATVKSHDHFQCTSCDMLRDTNVKDVVAPILESSIEGCSIAGRLTISGVCKKCSKGITDENNSV